MTTSESSSLSSANSTKINFTGICEYTSQPFQKETDLYCMASLQAPCFKPNDSEKRKGIDLVCIVDKSGSMSGVNIERVKSTLSFMFDQLTADDRVAIVEFNSTITTSLTLSKMNEQGRNQAKHIASNIHASGGTNISDALFEGLKLVGARELDGANEVTSIILLTDGMTNAGITSIEGIIEGMNALLEDLAKKNMNSISIHTFGFGTSTDANILGGIAQAGNGLFDVLETADDIPKAFGNVIGNLLSVVGQNIKVKIETKSNVSLKKVLTGFKVQQLTNGSEVIIGDVYSEEKKDIVFILSLPVAEHPIDVQELASVSLSYFNVIDLETELIGYDMTIDRNSAETPTKSESNYQLDIQRNRVEVGEAMSKARTLGDTNQLEQGRTVLNEAIAKVQASVSADEALCQDLIADMRNCLKKMDDRNNYKLFGNRMLNNCGRTNLAQRSSSSACSSSQKAYRTNNQNQFTNLFLNNVSSLTPVQPSQPQQQQTNSTNFILPTSSRSGNRPLIKSNRIITITKNSTSDQVNQ